MQKCLGGNGLIHGYCHGVSLRQTLSKKTVRIWALSPTAFSNCFLQLLSPIADVKVAVLS